MRMWYVTVMRWLICICAVAVLGSCKGAAFIPGTGALPDCNEPPVTDLNNTVWFNIGPATILTAGCQDIAPATVSESCPENWAFTQDANEIDIVVDVYRVKARLCGDKLYFEGGWWLSVVDEQGGCSYGDDDGDEFGIQAGGNVLTYTPADPDTGAPAQLKGILLLECRCSISYDTTFKLVRYPPPPS